ncbi:MAG: M20/M25/M40 family metallo-hydrolase [Thermodesulfobacteriota bacterium]
MQAALALARELLARLTPLAETSGDEARTAGLMAEFLAGLNPTRLLTGLGGHGVLAEFAGRAPGPCLLWRAELDAVCAADGAPAHLCGHDGHLAILAGLAAHLARNPPARGKVLLACQPAEETGQGAAAFLADPRLTGLAVDRALALHNLPGLELGRVVCRAGAMNCASVGLAARLTGAASHAAYPEQGRSPAPVLARLLTDLPALAGWLNGFGLVTIVHARLGRPTFGVNPGQAELMATLRADGDAGLATLAATAAELVATASREAGLEQAIAWQDRFAATVNHPQAAAAVARAAVSAGLPYQAAAAPFRWSEDFGAFCQKWPGALLVLGAGPDCPPLHSADYRFPPALLEPGLRLALACVAECLAD